MEKKRVYSIGELSRLLEVTPTAVRHWLSEGVIEQPELEGGGARLFTQDQVDRIKQVIRERRKSRRKERVRQD